MNKAVFLTLYCLIFLTAVSSAQSKASLPENTRNKKTARIEYGTASFYHDKFIGRQTANGDIFDQEKLTAAHNSLPFGTWIRVTNMQNKKKVVVQVNDRLHHRNKRLVDLSGAAASELG